MSLDSPFSPRSDDRTSSFGETGTKILDAAFRRLASDGYAALSIREIAKDAGVNHALINYHFGSKEQLVLAVLDQANRRLLARQESMYESNAGFAEKWAEARRFYAQDLASGFVRVQAELWAASFSNVALREQFVPRFMAWKELVHSGVRDALHTAERCGVRLPKPFTAQVIASLLSEFWIGMEFADLIGIGEDQLHHRATLDAIEHLLAQLDRLARKAGRAKPESRRSAPQKRKPRKRA